MKIPQRGEIWKADNADIYYYIISVEKFSVNCVSKRGKTYGVYRLGTFNFLQHHNYIMDNPKTDVADLFMEVK